jgi:soluble lytic murein transglycosylase-like protein
VQREILLSVEDGEVANTGCPSIFLFPPFSVLIFGALLFVGLSQISLFASVSSTEVHYGEQLSSIFAPQVLYWEDDIIKWSEEYDLDLNLIATVMQIESCGNPDAVSKAGAMGLFQVMPYHFIDGENPYSRNTNALRGLSYLQQSLQHFSGDIGLALAGYNGGISGASRPQSEWAQETIDYQYWGENIYAEASARRQSSPTLENWLSAGGASLCAQAEQRVTAAD